MNLSDISRKAISLGFKVQKGPNGSLIILHTHRQLNRKDVKGPLGFIPKSQKSFDGKRVTVTKFHR